MEQHHFKTFDVLATSSVETSGTYRNPPLKVLDTNTDILIFLQVSIQLDPPPLKSLGILDIAVCLQPGNVDDPVLPMRCRNAHVCV